MVNGSATQAAVRESSSSLMNASRKPNSNGNDNELGKEDFLNLMMAQMTHQDPMNPMDSQGMMDQLTSMGSLEQLMTLNKGVASLNSSQADMVRTNAYSFLDKDVTVKGGRVDVTGGMSSDIQFEVAREAQKVSVRITDTNGTPVREISPGRLAAGQQTVVWDKRDQNGDPVADGTYFYNVSASTSENESIPVSMFTRGKVSGVRFIDGRPVVKLNGGEVDLRDVVEVSNTSANTFGNQAPKPLRDEMNPKPLAGAE